jgi:hypothetical protein
MSVGDVSAWIVTDPLPAVAAGKVGGAGKPVLVG